MTSSREAGYQKSRENDFFVLLNIYKGFDFAPICNIISIYYSISKRYQNVLSLITQIVVIPRKVRREMGQRATNQKG